MLPSSSLGLVLAKMVLLTSLLVFTPSFIGSISFSCVFSIKRYKCDDVCCLLAVIFLRCANRDVSTVPLGRLGDVQLWSLHWVLVSRCEVLVLVLQQLSCYITAASAADGGGGGGADAEITSLHWPVSKHRRLYNSLASTPGLRPGL